MPEVTEGHEPLVEAAPEESVVRALLQVAYPVEFVEANSSEEDSD